MKKLLSLLVLLVLFVFSCQKQENSNEKVTIKVAAWNLAATAMQDVAKKYEEKNPNVKIEIIEVDSAYSKITPALASGQGAPDIIQLQARDLQSMVDKFDGQFYDLTEKLNQDGLSDKFLTASIEGVKKDGKVFAMPWDIGPVAMYYRKDMFEKAGINAEDIKTWDDFIKAGKIVQEKNPGVIMTGYQADNDFFHMLFNQLGGSYVKDGKLALDSPESIKAFELMEKLKNEGVLLDINDWNGRIIALNNDKIATVLYPVWYAGTLSSAVSDQKGKWGIFEMPAFEENGNRRSNLGGSVLAISSQSKVVDAAYDFLKFALVTNDGEDIMMSYGLFPAYTPYYETENFKKANEYFGFDINSYFASLTDGIPVVDYGKIYLDSMTPLNNLTTAIMSGNDIKKSITETSENISRLTKIEILK